MPLALIIYLLAGLGFCWALVSEKPLQRALIVPFWLPLIIWGMFCDLVDWWNRRGYDYSQEQGRE